MISLKKKAEKANKQIHNLQKPKLFLQAREISIMSHIMLKMTGRPKFAIKSQYELNSSKTIAINIHFKPLLLGH